MQKTELKNQDLRWFDILIHCELERIDRVYEECKDVDSETVDIIAGQKLNLMESSVRIRTIITERLHDGTYKNYN